MARGDIGEGVAPGDVTALALAVLVANCTHGEHLGLPRNVSANGRQSSLNCILWRVLYRFEYF